MSARPAALHLLHRDGGRTGRNQGEEREQQQERRFERSRLLSAQDTFHLEGTVNRQGTHPVNFIFPATYTESWREVPGTALACNLGESKELQ